MPEGVDVDALEGASLLHVFSLGSNVGMRDVAPEDDRSMILDVHGMTSAPLSSVPVCACCLTRRRGYLMMRFELSE